MGFFEKTAPKRPSSEPGEMEDIRSYQREQAIAARKGYQRVQDISHPTVKYGVPVAADTTAASWFGPIKISRASILTMLLSGAPTSHPIYALPCTPIDISVPTGCYIYSATGQVFMLQVGEWYIYIPSLSGDPATFNLLLTDASSELPAQQAALATGPGGSPVTQPSRAAIQTNQKNVAASGTPVQLTAMVVPGGYKLSVVAKSTNTQKIYFSDTSAHAQKASGVNGFLSPGQVVSFFLLNAAAIWIDADVNGEGVWYGAAV